jgi:hypothetical protein
VEQNINRNAAKVLSSSLYIVAAKMVIPLNRKQTFFRQFFYSIRKGDTTPQKIFPLLFSSSSRSLKLQEYTHLANDSGSELKYKL